MFLSHTDVSLSFPLSVKQMNKILKKTIKKAVPQDESVSGAELPHSAFTVLILYLV